MSESARGGLERALGLGLAVVAVLIATTCGSGGAIEHASVAAATRPPRLGPSVPLVVSPRAGGAAPERVALTAATGPATRDPNALHLPRFYADLAALERHERGQAVRILWLGDSHTAADYLTGALRARLQARFGAGGPGFVRVGVKSYRHSQVHWTCSAGWKVEPTLPSRRSPFDDAVFGLGGVRAVVNGAPAQASFELRAGAQSGQLRWQLWYSLGKKGRFRVELGGTSTTVDAAHGAPALPGAGFSALSLQSEHNGKLELFALSGAARFYGLFIESIEPGLVLDAVGIDGARVATALAWGEQSFETALQVRSPSLVVFAFGTNEAFDGERMDKYRTQYRALLDRVRRGAAAADCLLVGPPDANAPSGASEYRVAEIDALQSRVAAKLGCGYLSQLRIMGGPGGYNAWLRRSPPLARGDRLHLTAKGYEVMGNALADRVLAAYASH